MNRNDMAFPGTFKGFYNDDQFAPGLTMRDYIAIKAMQGALADPTTNPSKANAGQFCAGMYMIADLMIAESEKNNA